MTVAALLAGLLVACIAGFLAAWRLWPARQKPVLVLAALALPAGLSITSGAYFCWMVVSGGRASPYPWLEAAGVALAAWFVWHRASGRRERLAWPALPRSAPPIVGAVVILVCAATALVLVVRHARGSPWGFWDAWSRIDLKARFLCAGGEQWSWIFRGDGVGHPDYPLLLECSVARLARWCGALPLAAQTLSVLTWLGCLAALLVLCARLHSLLAAAAAGLAFLCKRPDAWWAAMHYADFALAAYFVWSAGVLALAARRPRCAERWWPLLGFTAGSAAWCKNEGLVFALILLVLASAASIRVPAPRRWRAARAGLAGAVLGGGATLVLKLGFASRSDVFETRVGSLLADLGDGARYRMVSDTLVHYARDEVMGWALLCLALAVAVAPARRAARRSWRPLVVSLALSFAFLAVLITAQSDLTWQVGTALDRLVLQLWPLAILALVAALPASRARAG